MTIERRGDGVVFTERDEAGPALEMLGKLPVRISPAFVLGAVDWAQGRGNVASNTITYGMLVERALSASPITEVQILPAKVEVTP